MGAKLWLGGLCDYRVSSLAKSLTISSFEMSWSQPTTNFSGALTGSKDPLQKIDQDQLDAYKRAFDEFDLDGDGKISTQVI